MKSTPVFQPNPSLFVDSFSLYLLAPCLSADPSLFLLAPLSFRSFSSSTGPRLLTYPLSLDLCRRLIYWLYTLRILIVHQSMSFVEYQDTAF